MRLGSRNYWGLVGNKGIILYSHYVRIILQQVEGDPTDEDGLRIGLLLSSWLC